MSNKEYIFLVVTLLVASCMLVHGLVGFENIGLKSAKFEVPDINTPHGDKMECLYGQIKDYLDKNSIPESSVSKEETLEDGNRHVTGIKIYYRE